MIFIVLLGLLWVGPIISFPFNPLPILYTSLFGDEDASAPYQELAQQAAQDYGYSGNELIPVKKMNSFAARVMGFELYSFTMNGIWINEKLINQCNNELRTWLIYHEVAHYCAGHHAKALGLAALMIPFVATTYSLSKSVINSRLVALLSAGLFAYGLHSYSLKPYVKEQEKEADLTVVRTMIATKRYSVIDSYINFLKDRIVYADEDGSDEWHYTATEQHEYIVSCYLCAPAVSETGDL